MKFNTMLINVCINKGHGQHWKPCDENGTKRPDARLKDIDTKKTRIQTKDRINVFHLFSNIDIMRILFNTFAT